jgi:isopenicillin N synthase-like dioxygenase
MVPVMADTAPTDAGTAGDAILDVDLLAFERGDAAARAAVVDGVMRSLATGFVYCSHDLAADLLDTAYGMLAEFFALPGEAKARWSAPGSHGQTGYTGVLVEAAADAEHPDWKEMLNWGRDLPAGHPLRRRYPHQYADQVLPDADVPGIAQVLTTFHVRLAALQQRFLRIVAVGLGADDGYFDSMVRDGATLSRAIRYPPMSQSPGGVDGPHVWAAAHGDINLVTALPRATARGLQVRVGAAGTTEERWIDAAPPPDHVVLNAGLMLERITNGRIEAGWHRVVADADHPGDRLSVVQFLHPTPWTVLAPLVTCVDGARPQRWAPIEAGALLDQVLYDINLVEDARRVR